MKKRSTESFFSKLHFWLLSYPTGILLGLFFLTLYITNRIKIKNWQRLPKKPQKLIVYANHPSLWEPLILPALFFKHYFFHPKLFSPWSAPDKINYGKNLFYFCFKPIFIFVPRNDKQGELKAFKKMLLVLSQNAILILHPEGGRTSTENHQANFLYSSNGKKIRKFKNGIGHLILQTRATALPVWIERSDRVLPRGKNFPRLWRQMIIKIGQPILFDHHLLKSELPAGIKKADAITKHLQNKLLKLADE